MSELAVRARGLSSRLIFDAALSDIEASRDVRTLGDALARAGLPADASVDAVELSTDTRHAVQLAILTRWSRECPEAFAIIELDEDRYTLRTIIRGVAAGVGADRRTAGAIATRSLPPAVLAGLGRATGIAEIAHVLARRGHPLAFPAPEVFDLFETEHALTRAFVACARPRDRALATYVTQLVDCANVASALLLAARGRDLDATRYFLDGGDRLDRAHFLAANRDVIARAFARTPIATAVYASSPAALEDAALTWQIATQVRLRRSDPHGLASVLDFVLRARRENRRLRRIAWRLALGGAR